MKKMLIFIIIVFVLILVIFGLITYSSKNNSKIITKENISIENKNIINNSTNLINSTNSTNLINSTNSTNLINSTNSSNSEVSCISAGKDASEYSYGKFMGNKTCCSGLIKIDEIKLKDGKCISLPDSGVICSACGNNICESWENQCNCQSDCR